jgi:Protein of unknown function (DUF3710)
VIFRRRSADKGPPNDGDAGASEPDELDRLSAPRSRGPWDRDETDVDQSDDSYVDLGGLVVKGIEGAELRLQVEDQQGTIAAVLLAAPESGLELRAFAAPRSGGIWDEVRADIAAEATRLGGTATETDGEFGTELTLMVPVQTPDGKQAKQPSRIVGVEGPRWLLRGTFLGKSALHPDPEGLLESAFRNVIVVRGNDPMAPRDMIRMQMPAVAQAQLLAEAEQRQADDDAQ